MALFLGTYGDPRGVGVSYGRGTPVNPREGMASEGGAERAVVTGVTRG